MSILFSKYALPLRLRRRPSLWLAAALLVLHGLAGAVVALLGLPDPVPLLLFAALLFSLIRSVSKQVWFCTADSVCGLVWSVAGDWQLELRNGSVCAAELLPGSYVLPDLVVMNFRAGRRRYAVVLPADGIDADSLRRLRVRLTWDRPRPTSEAES